jgi:hypothetical protein
MSTLSRVVFSVLLAAFAFPALCQKPQVTEVKQIPDYVLYDSFFHRVSWLNDLADNLAAQGKDGSVMRSAIGRQAGLTSQEEADLKAIVTYWRAATSTILSAAQSLTAAGERVGTSQLLQDLQKQRKHVTSESIDQLKATLGQARFKQFDVFVRLTSTVKAFHVTQAQK